MLLVLSSCVFCVPQSCLFPEALRLVPPDTAIARKVLFAAVRVCVASYVEDGLDGGHPVVCGDADGDGESAGGAGIPEGGGFEGGRVGAGGEGDVGAVEKVGLDRGVDYVLGGVNDSMVWGRCGYTLTETPYGASVISSMPYGLST